MGNNRIPTAELSLLITHAVIRHLLTLALLGVYLCLHFNLFSAYAFSCQERTVFITKKTSVYGCKTSPLFLSSNNKYTSPHSESKMRRNGALCEIIPWICLGKCIYSTLIVMALEFLWFDWFTLRMS